MLKKKMLKTVSVLGVVAMLASVMPQAAFAGELSDVSDSTELSAFEQTEVIENNELNILSDDAAVIEEAGESDNLGTEIDEAVEESFEEDMVGGIIDQDIANAIQAEVKKALEHASSASNDLEKVLMLHDYLLLNTHPTNPGENGSGAYQCLVQHKAVCSGYVAGFVQLLNAAGIEYKQISKDTGSYYTSHTWVMVKIDGNWYHIDPTNDDSGDVLNHKWFLKSDAAMKAKGASWSVKTGNAPVASDTSFDNAFWTNTQGEIIKKGGDFYYAEVDKYNGWYGIIKKHEGSITSGAVSGEGDKPILETDDSVHEAGDKIIQATNGAIIISDDSNAYIYKVKEAQKEETPQISPSEKVKDVIVDPNSGKVSYVVVDQKTGQKRTVDVYTDPTPPENPSKSKSFQFTDVTVNPGNWKYESIKYVYEHGYMSGTSDTTFGPSKVLTRGQFAQVLYNMEKSPAVSYQRIFSDVPDGKWYSKAITWAAQNKIVSGYTNGKFGLNDKITREQIAGMMMNYAKFKGMDTSKGADLSSYPDSSSVSGWAKNAVSWAVSAGVISGKKIDGVTYLAPKSDATRAECAAIIKNFMK